MVRGISRIVGGWMVERWMVGAEGSGLDGQSRVGWLEVND